MKISVLLAAMCGIFAQAVFAQTVFAQSATTEKQLGQNPFSFSGAYIGDTYYNMTGGLDTGGGFMGMANLKMGFDTGAARWWKGGSFFINGATIHGKSLSENYLGDLQVASNIDAGTHIYLHELWYRQEFSFGKDGSGLSFTVGLQDLNADFMVSEGAGEFINSSFGVPPVIATGIPVPIFPLTGLGLSARWNIDLDWTVQAALFDGDQTAFDHNPHNLHWNFSRNDGLLSMGEVHYDERFKLGAYYHSADRNWGIYALADQPVSERISLFGQIAYAPKNKNHNNYSVGLGANWFVAEKHSLGLAATHAGLHSTAHRHETALELYYKFALNRNIAIQPDLQYIVNPSGTGTRLRNALAGILRVHIDF